MHIAANASNGSFNPRAREGRDGDAAKAQEGEGVSTHAPARGATKGAEDGDEVEAVSTHAPARGATPQGRRRGCHHRRFNPRAREGRDGVHIAAPPSNGSFNPRAREGRDVAMGHLQMI